MKRRRDNDSDDDGADGGKRRRKLATEEVRRRLERELEAQRDDDTDDASSHESDDGVADESDVGDAGGSDVDGTADESSADEGTPSHWFETYQGPWVCCDNCKMPAGAAPCPVCLLATHCVRCGWPLPDHDCKKELAARFECGDGTWCTICDDKECDAEDAYNLIDERTRDVLLRKDAYDPGDPHVCCGNCFGAGAVPCASCGYDLWCPTCGTLPPHDCHEVNARRRGRTHVCSVCKDDECGAHLLQEDGRCVRERPCQAYAGGAPGPCDGALRWKSRLCGDPARRQSLACASARRG
jgi:hypothetical protein